MPHFLGIDAGGTATRWHLIGPGGEASARGEAKSISGHVFTDAARAQAQAVIAGIADAVLRLPGAAGLAGIAAGITGLEHGSASAAFFREGFAAAFRLEQSAVTITSDTWMTYLGCFAAGEGIVIYAGTGSIAMHLTEQYDLIRAGGHGALIDDLGSAVWIALEAIRAITAREDERPGAGWSTALGAHMAKGIGGAGWDQARALVYSGDRGRIGLLALAVARAALDGDSEALELLSAAGAHLAALGLTLRRRLGAKPVAFTGRAFDLHPVIAETLIQRIPGAKDCRNAVNAAEAAARFAADQHNRRA